MMGGLSAAAQREWESFGRRWLSPLVAILLRSVLDPALAFDLGTEALAATCLTECDAPPAGAAGFAELVQLAERILAVAADRHCVPGLERRRHGQLAPHRLTVEQQHEVMRLAEQHLELPEAARAAAEAFARTAPPPVRLRQIRPSGLVESEPLPDHERRPHGA
jgi:hypothetical protein